jgi:lipopolysaccharide/colanic/teichoic acid biosynthesis glycosyltransferase
MPTKAELERKIEIDSRADIEREVSDKKYAMKVVEKIVFSFVGLILIAVVTAIVASVVKTPK